MKKLANFPAKKLHYIAGRMKRGIFTLPNILLHNFDILVPVCACMFVVEPECVHDLVHGAPGTTEAVAILALRSLQR